MEILPKIREITFDKTEIYNPKIIIRGEKGSILEIIKPEMNKAEDLFYAILDAWNKYKKENI